MLDRYQSFLQESDELITPVGKYAHNPALNKVVALTREDITKLEIDAIVNAANRFLIFFGVIESVYFVL